MIFGIVLTGCYLLLTVAMFLLAIFEKKQFHVFSPPPTKLQLGIRISSIILLGWFVAICLVIAMITVFCAWIISTFLINFGYKEEQNYGR